MFAVINFNFGFLIIIIIVGFLSSRLVDSAPTLVHDIVSETSSSGKSISSHPIHHEEEDESESVVALNLDDNDDHHVEFELNSTIVENREPLTLKVLKLCDEESKEKVKDEQVEPAIAKAKIKIEDGIETELYCKPLSEKPLTKPHPYHAYVGILKQSIQTVLYIVQEYFTNIPEEKRDVFHSLVQVCNAEYKENKMFPVLSYKYELSINNINIVGLLKKVYQNMNLLNTLKNDLQLEYGDILTKNAENAEKKRLEKLKQEQDEEKRKKKADKRKMKKKNKKTAHSEYIQSEQESLEPTDENRNHNEKEHLQAVRDETNEVILEDGQMNGKSSSQSASEDVSLLLTHNKRPIDVNNRIWEESLQIAKTIDGYKQQLMDKWIEAMIPAVVNSMAYMMPNSNLEMWMIHLVNMYEEATQAEEKLDAILSIYFDPETQTLSGYERKLS